MKPTYIETQTTSNSNVFVVFTALGFIMFYVMKCIFEIFIFKLKKVKI